MTLLIEHLRYVDKLWLMDLKKNEDSMTCLHLAALNNHTQMLELLLELVGTDRLDVNAKCWNNQTPLHFCVARVSYEACEILFRMSTHGRSIDVNHQDNDGHTPLHDLMIAYSIANVWNNNITTTTTTTKSSLANELSEDKLEPKRPLDISPYARIGMLLIEKGANVEIRNKKMLTAFELSNEPSLVRCLDEHAKKNLKNK